MKKELIEEINKRIVTNVAKKNMVQWLTEAVVAVRHHKAPSKAIVTKLNEAHPEVYAAWYVGDQDKFESRKISVWTRTARYEDGISISGYPDRWSWTFVFEELRRYDYLDAEIEKLHKALHRVDEVIALDDLLRAKLEDMRAAIVNDKSLPYVVTGSFPLLFGRLPENKLNK